MTGVRKSQYVKHVLVIADNRLPRALIGAQLKAEGFEVASSDTLGNAVFLLEQTKIKPRLLIVESAEIAIDKQAIARLEEICRAPLKS